MVVEEEVHKLGGHYKGVHSSIDLYALGFLSTEYSLYCSSSSIWSVFKPTEHAILQYKYGT